MKINTEGVNSVSSNIVDAIADIKFNITKMNDLITSINDAWKGERASNFIDIYENKYLSKLSELEEDLEEYETFLSKTPRAYEMLDEEYGDKDINV